MDQLSKTGFDNLAKENKKLKKKLEKIKRENRDLKKSVYDLSVRYNLSLQQTGQLHKPFDIDAVISSEEGTRPNPTTQHSEQPQKQPSKDEAGFLNTTRSWNAGASTSNRKADAKKFYHKKTFTGHKGAVYCVRFSPSGNLFASGSFDKTVRLWDLNLQREVQCLVGHDLNVVDVCWSNQSDEILSGSYDKSVRLWDVATGKTVASFNVSGFVQCVEFNPANNNVFFVGSTNKEFLVFDKRNNAPIATVRNDSMVNTLYATRDGGCVLTGDANGNIKTWQAGDLARPCLLDSMKNESSRPISHLHVSPPLHAGEEGRYLAVNSYDNVLRIYDRGDSLINSGKDMLTLVSSLTGHRNKNWPIRSSFYLNKELVSGKPSSLDGLDSVDKEANDGGRERDSLGSLLLATGSADNFGYVFPLNSQGQGGEHVQQLSGPNGHAGRVYAVHFHLEPSDSSVPPSPPALLTASADNTVKLWTTPKAMRTVAYTPPSYDL